MLRGAKREEISMSTPPAPIPESSPASGSSSSISRIFGVLFNPKPTFHSIVQKPAWVAPTILICIASIAVIAVFTQRVGWRGFIAKQIENNPSAQRQFEGLTPEQRDEAIGQRAKIAPAFGYVFGVGGTIVVMLIVGGVLLGIFNISGADMSFKTSLAIVAYSWVPYVIHGIVGIIMILIKDPSTVDLQNLVASNGAVFASDDTAKWLTSLLTSLDVFTLWVLVLMGLGYSATNPKKIPFGKSFGIVLSLWLVVVLCKMAFAAFSS
jgi:hypothetical protein